MLDINSIVIQNFNENVTYFETYHPTLFSALVALENAIEKGHYQEKYELTYENNDFDVLEKSSGTLLYNGACKNHTSLALKSINNRLDNNIFETFHKRKISDELLKTVTKKEPFMDHLSGFAPIIHYIQEHTPEQDALSLFTKFIFFGTGLGQHITSIHEKISAQFYFIIEDDLELFRLSLFVTNYKELAKNAKLIFSVFEDNETFSITANKFLENHYQYNHYIKYFHMLNHSENKQIQLHQLIASQPHLTFFYHTMLKHYTRPLEYLRQDYRVLEKTISFTNKHLRDKPFLFLAAGPSLEKNKEWLQKNHTSFVIVAVAATLPFLESQNIAPEIIIQLDGHLDSIQHFEKLKSIDFIKNSLCIFSDKVPKSIMELIDKKQLFLYEHATKYKKNSLRPGAICVGSVGLEILVLLGVKKVYLLGLDLAIDKETGSTHASSHVNPRKIDISDALVHSDTLDYRKNLKETAGNHSKSVYTTQHFFESIQVINHYLKHKKQAQQNIVNLSDGAKFFNTVSEDSNTVKDLSGLDKVEVLKSLYKTCVKYSNAGLSSIELKSLDSKLSQAKIVKTEVKKMLTLTLSTPDKYLKELENFTLIIAKEESISLYEINRIIDTYLRYILPYIFHYLNREDTKINNVKKIRELLSEELLKIIDFYIEAFK